jgi:HK97 family phage major capsid protein
MNLQEMETQHAAAIAKAEAIIGGPERAKRPFSPTEQSNIDAALNEARALEPRIARAKKEARESSIQTVSQAASRIRAMRKDAGISEYAPVPPLLDSRNRERMGPKQLSAGYRDTFHQYVSTGAKGNMTAALYEGSDAGGGYAVPITMADSIVPLEPTASDIRSICTVIPTDKNYLLPTTAPSGLPIAQLTAELAQFGGTLPLFAQTSLSAYMITLLAPVSLQFAEDQPALEAYMRTVVESAFLEEEDTYFTQGTGSGEPQGLIGNVGAGVTEEPDGGGNMVSIDGTSSLVGQLKAKYLKNSSWLMNQTTALILRKSQVETNIFYPAWTRENGQDFLHRYPVFYSASMPTAARGNAPILFGDFKRGYIIGDRGGSALRLKVIDELLATQGVLLWLLYRRTDARVLIQEAIQQYNVALS